MPHLSEGHYYGKLVEIGTDRLCNVTQTPYVYVVWEVTHRAIEGEWMPIEPVRRESRWWVTEKAEPYTMDRLQRLGFNGEFDAPEFSVSPHPERDGMQLVCRHDVRDNQVYENWDLANVRSEKERQPWDTDQKRRFKAKYRTRLSARKQPGGKPPAPPSRPQPEPDTSPVRDDEVPGVAEQTADVPDEDIPF